MGIVRAADWDREPCHSSSATVQTNMVVPQ
jgi:hypothetical protein